MLNSQNRKRNTVLSSLLPILLWKTRQHQCVTYDVLDELRSLSLSKCFPALCHKLIYEIAIIHSINRETCEKTNIMITSPLFTPTFQAIMLIVLLHFMFEFTFICKLVQRHVRSSQNIQIRKSYLGFIQRVQHMQIQCDSEVKVLVEWIQFVYEMVAFLVQTIIQKTRIKNSQLKQRYWRK